MKDCSLCNSKYLFTSFLTILLSLELRTELIPAKWTTSVSPFTNYSRCWCWGWGWLPH